MSIAKLPANNAHGADYTCLSIQLAVQAHNDARKENHLSRSIRGVSWSEDNVPTHAGSLAFSTAFSIAPLLVIAIGICGVIFGQETSQHDISNALQGLLDPSGASAVESMIRSAARERSNGIFATIMGVGALFVGASSVFSQLQTSLNVIWRVGIKPDHSVKRLAWQRLLSLGTIIVMAFLLLVSLLVSAGIAGA